MSMTKFESTDDQSYIGITGELRRWIRELATIGAPSPDI